MINVKKYINGLLNGSSELLSLLGAGDKIYASYPDKITTFPCVIFEELDQSDTEYADMLPQGTTASITIHIFTKTLANYPTTSSIGQVCNNLLNGVLWNCGSNRELTEDGGTTKHRIMTFSTKFVY